MLLKTGVIFYESINSVVQSISSCSLTNPSFGILGDISVKTSWMLKLKHPVNECGAIPKNLEIYF